MAATKISVSVDEQIIARVRAHLGDETLSSFVAEALTDRLERAAVDHHIAELHDEFGTPSEERLERARALWPS